MVHEIDLIDFRPLAQVLSKQNEKIPTLSFKIVQKSLLPPHLPSPEKKTISILCTTVEIIQAYIDLTSVSKTDFVLPLSLPLTTTTKYTSNQNNILFK